MPELDLLNASPGDVVVPLSDVLDLLESALNNAELNDLSAQLIARRITTVQSGDVISAQLMNQMLADVANLQARVAELENGIPSQAAPTIILIEPNGGVEIGQQLQVIGTNLSLDTLNSVRIANRSVNAFGSASDDKLLVFDVPAIPGIPPQGANVNLTVSNDFGSDTYSVFVLQSEEDSLVANISVLRVDFPSGAILPGSTNDFRFRIVAATNLTEQYEVTTEISGDPGWSHEFNGGSRSQTVTINQTASTNTEIFFDTVVTAGTSGTATVWLNIQSVNFPDAADEDSETTELILNEEPQGDRDLTFIAPIIGTEVPEVLAENPDSQTGNILIRGDGAILITINVLMNVQGSCVISEPTIANNPGSAFSILQLGGGNTSPLISEGGTAQFSYQLSVSGSPTSTGLQPELQFTATHSVSGEIVEYSETIQVVGA